MAKVVARTATEALKVLWAETFFHGWKKKSGIDEKLAQRGNHFSDAELGMALKRASYLTRRGRSGSFEYIQKHPFIAEEPHAQAEKKGSHSRRSRQNRFGA
jgi:hypothetical protein